MKLIVILPARNEGKTIAQCTEIAKKSKYEPEVLVVDGNSSDKTREEATNAGAIVIRQSRGIGRAEESSRLRVEP